MPPSKSQTLRALLFGALGRGKTTVYTPLISPDTECMVRACRSLGVKVEGRPGEISLWGIDGEVAGASGELDVGNSGILLRFLTAVVALGTAPVTITGDRSICTQRPLMPLISALQELNVEVRSERGFAPVSIKGPLCPGKATVSGEDSQPVSALLIAMAFAQGPSELKVTNPGEKPWVALTLDWLDRLGIRYQAEPFETYRLSGFTSYEGFTYTVPGDWSTAAFPIAAALITRSELTIENLDIREKQGDKEIVAILQKMGARIQIDGNALHVEKSGHLRGITVDINDCIDAVTILAVVACFAEGETILTNAKVAATKECNRLECIALELGKMGGAVRATADGLVIEGRPLHGASVYSHGDHRMAMSLAVAAIGARGASRLEGWECVHKTYGAFFEDMRKIGAKI